MKLLSLLVLMLGPWGEPDSLVHLYGGGPSISLAQSWEAPKELCVKAAWIRGARTGNPKDKYYVRLTAELGGSPIARSLGANVSDVVDERVDWRGEWIAMRFKRPVCLDAGNYFIEIYRLGAEDRNNYLNVILDSFNPIANQDAWIKSEAFGWQPSWKGFDDFLLQIDYINVTERRG